MDWTSASGSGADRRMSSFSFPGAAARARLGASAPLPFASMTIPGYAALVTFPALRQRVQTRTCARLPSTMACTLWRFGRLRFFVLLFAWLTWLPVSGPLPHRSHLNAIDSPTATGRRKIPAFRPESSRGDLLAADRFQRVPRTGAGRQQGAFQSEAGIYL